jgi:HlyD family secretion protein
LGLDRELAEEATNAQARASELTASAPKQPAAPMPASKNNRPGPSPGIKAVSVNPAVLITGASDAPAPKVSIAENLPVVTPRAAREETNATEVIAPARPHSVVIDFAPYANVDVLGDGEAKQKLRKFEDDLQVAKKEEGQAKSTLDGTKRLFEKGFVTKIEAEKDELAYENNRLKVQTAETARDLFLKYEFPKTSEESLSKHSEAVRELSRAEKAAVSKLAQAQAKLKSAQGQYNIQSRQQKDLYEQLDKCKITAQRPGLVVYGGGREEAYYGGEERIREGASVRERQAIITIPDMTKMSVKVKIHETYIKKVKKGEKAKITVDAYPDKIIEGEVTQVGVLPDSQNMWMNPDLKVYLTTVTLDGTNEWLKPGMTAKVEIFVSKLDDVIYVPVQAVSADNGKQVCQVMNGRQPDKRIVEVGDFNDEFIAVKTGLKEGEKVLLRATEAAPPEKKDEQPKKDQKPEKPSSPSPGPAAAQARKV